MSAGDVDAAAEQQADAHSTGQSLSKTLCNVGWLHSTLMRDTVELVSRWTSIIHKHL